MSARDRSAATPVGALEERTQAPAGRPRAAARRRLGRWLAGAVAIAGAIALWQVLSIAADTILFPTPAMTVRKGWELARSGVLLNHILASLGRIGVGFVAGSAVGIAVGLAMGSSGPLHAFFSPLVQFFRFVPAIAWISPAIVWFGIGETSKILLIAYTTTFILTINVLAGVHAIEENKLRAARSLGAGPLQVFTYVIVPGSVHYMLTGMRIAMGNSFMTIVAAEMLAAERGLGYLIISSRIWMSIDAIFVGIFALGVLGLLADRGFQLLANTLAREYHPTHPLER